MTSSLDAISELALLRLILNSMHAHAVTVVDSDLRYQYAFGPLLLILQVTPEVLIGETVRGYLERHTAMAAEEITAVEQGYCDAMRGTGTVIVRERFYGHHWIEQILFPIHKPIVIDDSEDLPGAIFAVIADCAKRNVEEEPLIGAVSFLRDIDHRKLGELHNQMLLEATADALTRLGSRAAYERALAKLRPPTTLLAVDVNSFKQINDTRGHDAGDAVLVEIARCIEACIRPSDRAFRPGGDEFAVLLADTEATTGHHIAVRIRLAVTRALGDVSVSVGVATLPSDGVTDAAALVSAADRNMYIDKRNKGR